MPRLRQQVAVANVLFPPICALVTSGAMHSVAQICNLLYRRIAFCGTWASARALELSDALPITNRRYGRLQICATRPRRALTHTDGRTPVSFSVQCLGSRLRKDRV